MVYSLATRVAVESTDDRPSARGRRPVWHLLIRGGMNSLRHSTLPDTFRREIPEERFAAAAVWLSPAIAYIAPALFCWFVNSSQGENS